MEGVVLKPEVIQANAAPYMKVRNKDYLSIIYGYDYGFPHKYKKLMKQKNINPKLRTSMNEYRLGNQMLSIRLDGSPRTMKSIRKLLQICCLRLLGRGRWILGCRLF